MAVIRLHAAGRYEKRGNEAATNRINRWSSREGLGNYRLRIYDEAVQKY